MELDALYRDVVEASADGIWVFDLNGRTLHANPEIARMFGVSPAEAQRLTVLDTLDEQGPQEFTEHLRQLRSGHFNEHEVEVRFQRRDGTGVWVLCRESALRGADGTVTGVLHRLTAGRRRAARARRRGPPGQPDGRLRPARVHGLRRVDRR